MGLAKGPGARGDLDRSPGPVNDPCPCAQDRHCHGREANQPDADGSIRLAAWDCVSAVARPPQRHLRLGAGEDPPKVLVMADDEQERRSTIASRLMARFSRLQGSLTRAKWPATNARAPAIEDSET